MKFNTIIVGAGPAGMMAAIAAARRGKRVIVFEAKPRPGLKLLASGGGRCNLTNTLEPEAFMARFGRHGRFMTPALRLLPPDGLRRFLAELGVQTHHPDGFHVFPVSHDSRTVLDALLGELGRLGVDIRLETPVKKIRVESGACIGLELRNGETVFADSAILAAGGLGYPALGGGGSGLRIAEATGHRLVDCCPAMVPLTTAEAWPADCTANTIPKACIQVDLPKCGHLKEEGDLIFTHTGIGGPVVQDLSGKVSRLLLKHETVPLLLNLCHGKTEMFWRDQLRREEAAGTSARVVKWLQTQRVKRMFARIYCAQVGNIADKGVGQLGRRYQDALAQSLAKTPLTVTGTAGWSKAMVTSGGISLKDVDPATLMSRRVRGLFFAGEMVDLDGPCGGFNLTWAFASGWLAGSRV